MMKKLITFLLILGLATTLLLKTTSAQIKGDIDGDSDVDIYDLTLAASQYRLSSSDPGYNTTIVKKADLAEPYNNIINIFDIITILYHYTG